ncbi:MAG: hypothetical protein V4574_08305, partial [Pseudomonadota bacterium]
MGKKMSCGAQSARNGSPSPAAASGASGRSVTRASSPLPAWSAVRQASSGGGASAHCPPARCCALAWAMIYASWDSDSRAG